jgi:hypothetical protein
MKKLIGLLALTASTYAFSANAQVPLPFTRCEIDVQSQSILPALVDLGPAFGQAICWDAAGNAYTTPVTGGVIGGSASLGFCSTKTHFSAVGAGFALDNLLNLIPSAHFTPFNRGPGLAVSVNVLGVNVSVAASVQAEANCASAGELKLTSLSSAGPTVIIIEKRHARR